MAVIKYKDPNTGEYISEVYVEDAVASVNGETGAVTIDAEKIEYDPDSTHTVGSVGFELSDINDRFITENAEEVDVDGRFLPIVTVADNGMFLRVTNGAWTATSIPSAGGTSF